MEYIIPHYFDKFRCVAAECTDTCCAGWEIMIDEESLERYKKLKGTLAERVRDSIDWEKGSFYQHERRCAFLNEDNLCDMHLLCGEDMLCDTCRNYPRHMEEYEGLREGSLSLSCIEAAKIILGCEQPVHFVHLKDETEDEEDEDFDFLLFTKLMDARELIIRFLQNRQIDIMVRIGVVLKFTDEIQSAINDQEVYRIDDILGKYDKMDTLIVFQRKMEGYRLGGIEHCNIMRKMFRCLSKLEVLKFGWSDYLKRAERILYGEGQRAYTESYQRFHKSVGLKSGNSDDWSRWLEHLVIYYVFIYFCGAVYDDKVLTKMQLAVVCVLLVEELSIAVWKEKGEKFTFEDFVDMAHHVSREIEHSDINLLRLEKMFEQQDFFQVEQLENVLLY